MYFWYVYTIGAHAHTHTHSKVKLEKIFNFNLLIDRWIDRDIQGDLLPQLIEKY